MFYFLYETRNLINNKIYVGAHRAEILDDKYLGSGKLLNQAIKKYGRENFRRTILEQFDSESEMMQREREIVNEEFIHRKDTYNIKIGGTGGFTKEACRLGGLYIAANGGSWSNPERQRKAQETQRRLKLGWRNPSVQQKAVELAKTPESRAKRQATYQQNNHQQGKKNSQYGTCWITDGENNKKIKTTELETFKVQGWKLGRKLKRSFRSCDFCHSTYEVKTKEKFCSDKCRADKKNPFLGKEADLINLFLQTKNMDKAMKILGFPGAHSHYHVWARSVLAAANLL